MPEDQTGERPLKRLPTGAIRLDGVSRRFRIQHAQNRTLKTQFLRRTGVETRDFWALRNLDLAIPPGESLGIIGRNGSGKSTILKLIAGIIGPTGGTVRTSGTIASMLELGAGFHPDFSGRENIFLNAAIFGMSEKDVTKKFDEIVAFAEVEDFIDSPVRTYSSGMHMRLAFSIASHVRADIMLLDEVFAVGDEAFQRKCLGRMYEFRRHGGTIVFVSHDAFAVERICSRAILMEHGKMLVDSVPREVMAEYHRLLAENDSRTGSVGTAAIAKAEDGSWGTREVTVSALRLCKQNGTEAASFFSGEPLTIDVEYTVHTPVDSLNFSFAVKTMDGLHCFGTTTENEAILLAGNESGLLRFTVPSLPLLEGRFSLDFSLADLEGRTTFHAAENAHEFSVFPQSRANGIVDFGGRFEVRTVQR